MINVALYGNDLLKNNLCFNRQSYVNQDNRIEHIATLKEYLFKKGINLQTLDKFKRKDKLNCIIQIDNSNRISTSIPTILILFEVDTVIPKNWSIKKLKAFDLVLTIYKKDWDKIYSNIRYFSWPVFLPISKELPTKDFDFNYGLVSGNKFSYDKNSTFALRREIIKFFEINNRNDFKHFGLGWNKTPQPVRAGIRGKTDKLRILFGNKIVRLSGMNYGGTIENKVEFYKKTKFVFCIENSLSLQGYLTEKLWEALCHGSVPIYFGDTTYSPIDKNSFILGSSFDSIKSLIQYCDNIQDDEYFEIQKKGHEFISKCHPYILIDKFCNNLYKSILNLV